MDTRGKNINHRTLVYSDFLKIPIALFVQEQYQELNNNDRFVYARLADRADLSSQRPELWLDKDSDEIYSFFTQEEMAKDLGLNVKTVRTCFRRLEEVGLIRREEKYEGLKKIHKIFVYHPKEGLSKFKQK